MDGDVGPTLTNEANLLGCVCVRVCVWVCVCVCVCGGVGVCGGVYSDYILIIAYHRLIGC